MERREWAPGAVPPVSSLPGMDLDELRGEIDRRLGDRLAASGLGVERVSLFEGIPAMETAADSAIVRAAEALTPSAWSLPDPRIGLSYQKNPGSVFDFGEARMRMLTVSQTVPFPLKITSRASLSARLIRRQVYRIAGDALRYR